MPSHSPELENLKAHFKLEGFPTDQLLVRSETEVNRTVSFASASVCQLLSSEDICRLKVINTGVKAFQRVGDSRQLACLFRLQSECLSYLVPFLPPSMVVEVTPRDMKILLEQPTPLLSALSSGVQARLLPLEQGTVVITFDPSHLTSDSDEGSGSQPRVLVSPESASQMMYPLWKAKVSVNLMLAKQEQRSLLHRLFGSDEDPKSTAP